MSVFLALFSISLFSQASNEVRLETVFEAANGQEVELYNLSSNTLETYDNNGELGIECSRSLHRFPRLFGRILHTGIINPRCRRFAMIRGPRYDKTEIYTLSNDMVYQVERVDTWNYVDRFGNKVIVSNVKTFEISKKRSGKKSTFEEMLDFIHPNKKLNK